MYAIINFEIENQNNYLNGNYSQCINSKIFGVDIIITDFNKYYENISVTEIGIPHIKGIFSRHKIISFNYNLDKIFLKRYDIEIETHINLSSVTLSNDIFSSCEQHNIDFDADNICETLYNLCKVFKTELLLR